MDRSLAQRLITAVVLVPSVIAAIILMSTEGVAILFGVVVLVGAWEWCGLIGWATFLRRAAYVLLTAIALAAGALCVPYPGAVRAVLVAGLLWWLVALVTMIRYQLGRGVRTSGLPGAIAGWMVMVPAWLALVWLHGHTPSGPWLVLLVLTTIWAADTGAYFAGRRWGRTRLASRISPGKSWEGVAGGLAAVVVLATAASVFIGPVPVTSIPFVVLCVFTAAFSIIGDLAESLFKREAGVKDSGSLLPGHGGVLDRVDSLMSAAPVFVLGLQWAVGR